MESLATILSNVEAHVKSEKELYRELIQSLLPLEDDLAGYGAPRAAIDACRRMVEQCLSDYAERFGEAFEWR